MTQKEKFLKISSYEEFDRRRDEFKGLKPDKEIIAHLDKIFPEVSNTKEELYKSPPGTPGRSIGR